MSTAGLPGREGSAPSARAGSYTLIVQGDGVAREEVAFEVAAGQELRRDVSLRAAHVREVLLELPPEARRPTYVAGEVTGADGRTLWSWARPPVPVGAIRLRVSAPAGSHRLQIRTDVGLSADADLVIGGEETEVLRVRLGG